MPSPFATAIAEAFSAKVMQEMYAMSVYDLITNRDYEGDVNAVGSVVNILSLARISEQVYTGANLTPASIQEINGQLTLSQQKAFYWKENTIDKWKSYIKEPKPVIVTQLANERKKNVDNYILGFNPFIAAGNRIGTDYTTGTVAVDATTGVVTGSGTTFTSAMVGKGFTCQGLTGWYRIVTYTSATSITIQNDTYDDVAAYTGGAITAGATFTVQANTPLAITASNIMKEVIALSVILDNQEVPAEDRFLILHPTIAQYIPQGTGIALNVPAAYEDLVVKGFMTELLGFNVIKTPRVQGDNVNGYHCIAANRNWLTFADKVLEAGLEEDQIGNFGSAFKDLYVYGAKVTDNRLKFAAELFCTG
jgi:hypothetical protein